MKALTWLCRGAICFGTGAPGRAHSSMRVQHHTDTPTASKKKSRQCVPSQRLSGTVIALFRPLRKVRGRNREYSVFPFRIRTWSLGPIGRHPKSPISANASLSYESMVPRYLSSSPATQLIQGDIFYSVHQTKQEKRQVFSRVYVSSQLLPTREFVMRRQYGFGIHPFPIVLYFSR